MDATTTTARRAATWGRIIGLVIAIPIYMSLLTTLPTLAAVLVLGLYFGLPVVVRKVVTDQTHRAPTVQ